MSFFRIQPTDRPDILDPENQTSTSWNDLEDTRHGVSVCNSREELAEYLAQTGIPFQDDWELLEIDGPYSDEEDEDEHLGCSLILPTEIIARETIGDAFVYEILDAYDNLAA
ncbi:hypothetical protein CFAL_12135 (plasmid) [Corynebacterium falsenii DSM 44353]|uniref:hypothetical protein n=1 Tax=Corynebacterium falsenii TaxID=108486 RepID=UPI0003E9686B|nr:hypothetical protein [Corynebacterium falsenii]AHI04358.1 hypothetical protein CFAL_09585 [Corynebacterium falsenii DSM 44353]AHI04504.1 hypothetical protein CFAL_12135 [Corynebacterium falsenii DSM 44353]UBI04562.1 hypothetical protein LA343_11425 [Corynebacterium falsenii]